MRVQFLVENTEEYTGELFQIVESYESCEWPYNGYDVYEVDTDSLKNIRVYNKISGTDYEACDSIACTDSRGDFRFVSVWSPIEGVRS